MVSNISKRWNQIEQKQDFWRSLTFEGSQKGAKGNQKGAKGSQKGAKDQENHQVFSLIVFRSTCKNYHGALVGITWVKGTSVDEFF